MGLIRKYSSASKPFVVGKVRQSQAITTFGIGSMVDFVNQTAIICGTDKWDWCNDKEFKIHNVNLQNLLNVKYFVKPKISLKENAWENDTPDLPAVIFPKTLYNPKCQTLEKAGRSDCKLDHGKYKCYCEKCKGKSQYLPSRFVLVCPKGHIEDFPYEWWVHEAQGKERCEKPKLRMYYVGNKTDMDSLFVECTCCGAKRSMKGASARNAFANYSCSGNRPWLGDKETCTANEEQQYMQMRIRNESSVYFPCTVSALTIPPWSTKLAKKIQENKTEYERIVGPLTDSDKPRFIEKLCKEFPYFEKLTIEELLNKLLDNETEVVQTMQSIMEDEYDAILTYNTEDKNSDYLSHEEEVPAEYNHIIDKTIAIERLTVVTAMVGFTRLTAPTGYNDPNLVPISKSSKEWYPGIEQRGEGIFIKFNQTILDKWMSKYGSRYEFMGERLKESFFENDRFSPQYVFLHTFAHLFIRELSNLCGYTSASIKERIYSTYKDGKKKMAGVLVYTSTADSDGSLGGLTEQAQKINMERLLKSLLERGKWCSSDPVCYTSKEQGFMSLNYAACFACTLLPETSCEFKNVLLDRCSVCGMPGNEELGLLNWRK